MTWFKHQCHLLKLFVLGALLPFAACLLLLGLGFLAWAAYPWCGFGLAALGSLLLVPGCQLLFQNGRSWPLPPGRRVGASEAPELRAWLKEGSHLWKGPGVKAVVLDTQSSGLDLIGTPTLGVLGWTRFTWVLGYFPFLALSEREFEAMASWEAVWWSDQQGWLNLQVKRLANHWQQLYLQLNEAPQAWIGCAPVLLPCARAMVRLLEPFLVRECLWADAVIAEQYGASTLARALCRLALLRPLLDRRILPELLDRLQAGEPWPESLSEHLAEALRRSSGGLEGTLELALDGLVAEAPPLLRLRLLHLGTEASVPMPLAVPVFHYLLAGTALLREAEDALKAGLQAQLDQLALGVREGDRRFLRLTPARAGGYFDQHHALEYLKLAFDRLGAEAFWEPLARFCQANPSHPEGKLLLVQWTLRQGWLAQAEAQVQALLVHNPFLAPRCHSLLAAHHRSCGALAQAEGEWNLARRAEAVLERARRERGSVSLGDALEPHGCPSLQLQAMVRYLSAQGELGEAYLVRKKVALHPEHPVLLLVVRAEGPWWDLGDSRRRAFQARISRDCPFPGRATGHVLVMRPGLLWRYRRLLTGLGALILNRTAA